MSDIKKCGIITLCGRPNVGKSTLTNALVGEKVAIVSSKPQTTRNRICAILNRGDSQFVFVDTPGLHKARTRLGDYMVKVVRQSVADVDGVCLLVEPIPHIGEAGGGAHPAHPGPGRCRRRLVINKIDTVEKEELLAVMAGSTARPTTGTPWCLSPPSTGEGVDELLEVLARWLPEGPQLFPDGHGHRPARAAGYGGDRPGEAAAQPGQGDPPRHRRGGDEILPAGRRHHRLPCDHLLREGSPTRASSSAKREPCSRRYPPRPGRIWRRFMGDKVYLEVWIKVQERWRDDAAAIRNFGYTED